MLVPISRGIVLPVRLQSLSGRSVGIKPPKINPEYQNLWKSVRGKAFHKFTQVTDVLQDAASIIKLCCTCTHHLHPELHHTRRTNHQNFRFLSLNLFKFIHVEALSHDAPHIQALGLYFLLLHDFGDMPILPRKPKQRFNREQNDPEWEK